MEPSTEEIFNKYLFINVIWIYFGTRETNLKSECVYTVWWLILCQLDWVRNAQITSKYYFWMCVSVFLEEISIWISRLSKDLLSPTCGRNQLRVERWKKGEFSFFLFLSWDAHLLLPSGTGASGSQAFWLWDSHQHPHPLPPSKAFDLGLNFTTDVLVFPACRWQIVGLLGFHNPASQFLQ